MVLRQYPAILKKIKTRSQDYNRCLDEIERQEKEKKIFVIRPPYPLEIGTVETNKDELKRVYQIGINEGQKQLAALKKYLKE